MRTLLAAAVVTLVACAPPPTVQPDPVVQVEDDGGVTAPPDAGTPCDGVNGCALAWSESAPYPVDVDHHTTFVAESAAGSFLYVAGGAKNKGSTLEAVYKEVRRARIAEDGSLGAWTDCAPLPLAMGFHALGQRGRHVYLMAGVSQDAAGPFAQDTVLVGTVRDDGDLDWVKSPQRLGVAFIHGTGAVVGDTLLIIGGTGGSHGAQGIVKQAALSADGSVGAWSDGAALPQSRSHHTAVVRDGHAYLIGGFDGSLEPISDVLRSVHDAAGGVTGWARVGEITAGPWTSGAFSFGNGLFLVGGGEGGGSDQHFVDHVRVAQLYENGTLAPFADLAPLPVARAHVHQAPQYRGRVYSVGGRVEPQLISMGRVFVGVLSSGSNH